MNIRHFNKVDTKNIVGNFTRDLKHRSSLTIPFIGKSGHRKLCIIGQNPSKANEVVADKTLHYLERYVYEKLPQYSGIIMLNLFSRIDTDKSQLTDPLRLETEREYRKIISNNTDFLIVYGAIKNQGIYKFKKKAFSLKRLLSNKYVYKININSVYAPHPGNPKIHYRNYCFDIDSYNFSDV